MTIGNDHPYSYRMFGAKTRCRNCGATIHFSDAQRLAQESGVHDNVIMCFRCRHVYSYVLIPGSLSLDMDVTERYPGVRPAASSAEPSGTPPEAPARQRQRLLAKIFRNRK